MLQLTASLPFWQWPVPSTSGLVVVEIAWVVGTVALADGAVPMATAGAAMRLSATPRRQRIERRRVAVGLVMGRVPPRGRWRSRPGSSGRDRPTTVPETPSPDVAPRLLDVPRSRPPCAH